VTAAGDPAADLQRYYASRAAEYDTVYDKPERQQELADLRARVSAFGQGRRVLEVACGTGYWTVELARSARSVRATDATEQVLVLARARRLDPDVVSFAQADAFRLEAVAGEFDAALAGFWWSHVALRDRTRFLVGLHRRLSRPARVMLFDNRYVEGSSTPISRVDLEGNTYQVRHLTDGTTHEIIKNFPTSEEIRGALAASGAETVEIAETTHFWSASYSLTHD
jgi:2-polyprenyl-3-methyl-5-hydroxy-6-metoxy-1,4-benzoquinol methylase